MTWSFLSFALLLSVSNAFLMRKDVDHLTPEETLNLQKALREVNADTSAKGYAAIAAYHGFPAQCSHEGHDIACCIHGMPVFPQWHRLFVVQMEQALKEKGLSIGIPYWDWTHPLHHLPELVSDKVFIDTDGGKAKANVWYQGDIHIDGELHHTARAVDARLYEEVHDGEFTDMFEQVLNALEYPNYCQFEVQFEIAHNTIHFLVGGRNKYSMSHLEYTSYDPIFFLHHSNVDRIYAVYEAIQKSRGYIPGPSCHGECELCDVKGFQKGLEPFSRDSNPFSITKHHSNAYQATDHSLFGYRYDNLTLNGYNLDGLIKLVEERKSHDRAFASFNLHGLGVSADVRVKVCIDKHDDHDVEYCELAGDFFILGGPLEMPWHFNRPYYFDITKTVLHMDLSLEGDYHVEADLYSVNGTKLDSHLLPHPSVHFRPAVGKTDPPIAHNEPDHEHEYHEDVSVRKCVDRLTREEIAELRQALEKFEHDTSVDGFQAIAEFHGDPGKCPTPDAKDRLACCIHGMPNFPHWHRLQVVQVEDALRRRGAHIGIPYWDFTKPNTHIPALAADETFTDPSTNEVHHNPFHDAEVAFLGIDAHTTRDVMPELSETPEWGDHTELFDAFLLALEQDNFCDFEVQFEVAHNLIHGLVGGNTPYGMSSLSYSAFDPLFYLYHSGTDRIWAIWTALQQYRGKPYKAHCAQSYIHTPLKPFAFHSPYNNNEKTYSHSVPTNIYDYEEELGYTYDSLEFGGMSIPELDNYINDNLKGKSRTFVGVMLHGIKKSGWATIHVNTPDGKDYEAGHFALLGGPSEMEWEFDRLYRHDITHALEELGLYWAQAFDVKIEMHEFDGTPIDMHEFPPPTIIYKSKEPPHEHGHSDDHIRKNVESLTAEEILDLRHALANLEDDHSVGGYQDLGRFHGTPNWCPSPDAAHKVACCLHGMPAFPHWHRLLVVQAENALRRHGYHGGLPYWDWTQRMTHLPDIVTAQTYIDPSNGQEVTNPFFSAHIDDADHDTVRSVRDDLYQQPAFGEYTDIAKQVMLALEQDNFCDFEVQFEIAHNFIHALVGGSELYSMASLRYTAFDPLFLLHHSNTDRIWAVWQALQKYRGKPYNSANCAIGQLRKPMAPFSLTSDINPDSMTREHSIPFQAFDYHDSFHYEYDNLEFNGLTIPQLARRLEQNKAQNRDFVGFNLHGIQHSALVKFYICKSEADCNNYAGEFYILGDEFEMPWAYDRLYKYDITHQLEDLKLRHNDRFYIRYEILDLAGHDLGQLFTEPTVLHEVGTSHLYGQEYREAVSTASHVRRNLASLSKGEIESLRAAFLTMQVDGTYEKIASFHGKPGMCEHDGHKVACCVHGMPTFPAWHRLYVEQVEDALLERGSSVAVPYWDWIEPFTKLPDLIGKSTYYNSRKQTFDPNPFFSGHVFGEDAVTTRDPQPELFNNNQLYEEALLALEQTNFCDFEIQFEILHNELHSLLGGHAEYSLSSLDYSAYDPVFFLHHSATDRIWAIWQELQRYRGLPYNEADCAINLMRKSLHPFDMDVNTDRLTHEYNHPADTFDYRNHLHYEYDTLEFNHMTIPQLENLLHKRQESGRVFAGFLLHNIGLSADVDIYVCVPSGPKGRKNCEQKAGHFSILGGETEMPFAFDRLYKYDITHTVRDLGLKLDHAANFELMIEIHAVNGSLLDSHILPNPTILFEPGTNERQHADGEVTSYVVRKSVDSLSPREKLSLIKALQALEHDHSADGFQALASFHALPPLCPDPSASHRYACCIHGMATFPQWHRLYTVQMEDALRRHGSLVGIPYWDWTRATDHLPALIDDETYTDPYTHEEHENPWHGASIDFEHSHTEREVLSDFLFKFGPHGWDTWLFNQALLALEQEDFCDFEIQFEITHNAIHSWIGGSKEHSLGHLHYASYDPAFFVHHSNTDRLWAVWQALQEHRGHNPNEAHCALEQMRDPLKPFSFGAPYNLNHMTEEYSKPEDTFDYEDHFHYRYDDLEFVGMSIPALDAFIKERQEHDRVFAGFLLKGFGSSAFVDFTICDADMTNCFEGGHFTILGGSAEMPWQFDRVYKYEITDVLDEHHLRYDDDYHFHVHIKAMDGTELDHHLIPEPSVIFEPAHHDYDLEKVTPNFVRRNLKDLSDRDIQSLKSALRDLQHDDSNDGWANLASFHGAPARCPDPEHPTVACCIHGMPSFPHWHRLFTVQVEQALHRHGSSIAIPYWDWTLPIDDLPEIFTIADYYDVWRDEVVENPFAHGYVPSEDVYTVRDVRPEIHDRHHDGKHSSLLYLVIQALEKTDYCDFEVHFEVMHNAIHYLVGGHQTYSLSSLEYSAYDPMFFIHHSFTDKIWAVWQELQKRRHLPYNKANCALNHMNEPMKPFNFDMNMNKFTKDHSTPNSVFNHEDLGYAYDNLDIGGYNLEELEEIIDDWHAHPRVQAGFLLKGIKTSGSVVLNVCIGHGDSNCHYAGRFNLLGGPTEHPWTNNRLFRDDITWALKEAGFQPEDVFDPEALFHLDVKVYDVEGHELDLESVMPPPTIIFVPAAGHAEDIHDHSIAGRGVRKDVRTLTVSETENLRKALGKVMADNGPNGFQKIASFHGSPPQCELDGHPIACCIHGMANFPQWHRLFVKQFEDALVAQGARVGIPYWDWTAAFTELPGLVTEEDHNPFHHGKIYNGEITTRAPRDLLFNDPEFGDESFFYRQALLAFEQTDYCDFEVQFEITHNAIHSWTGGRSPYGMSTLEYTAYDPLFLLHHSNVDRQFAIWQALQHHRHLPDNSANCAIQHLRQPMRPFSDESNVNPTTRANSRAIDAFDYHRLNYQYDNLNFHGLTISQLHDLLEHRKEEDRIFAEFLLHGFGASADVSFDLCDDHDHCEFAGTFAVLGGPLEMPWAFDRLFKYDVTNVFQKMHLEPDSKYHFDVHITAVNGTELDHHLIRDPSVRFVPGVKGYYKALADKTAAPSDKLIRKDVNHLTLEETADLRNALNDLQQDHGPNGFEAIAGFHGAPFKCPNVGDEHYACCVHGMPNFPHWHRLLTVQFEQALKEHGSHMGVPYWDWTAPISSLPRLFGENSLGNPFYNYEISFAKKKTTREVKAELYNPHKINGYNYLYYLALTTLEEDNYCDFEVQYEVLHNEIHALLGGSGTYSMATLDYSAFDPVFMIHHSSIDRIWIIWQELQKRRHKPFNDAHCAGHILDEPLHPFNYPDINKNDFTRLHSSPSEVFDANSFGYEFDKLELNGHDVDDLNNIIHHLRDSSRIYIGFVLHGYQSTLDFDISLIDDAGAAHHAGGFHVLGGEKEMPWAYERIFKYDVTDVAHEHGITTDHPVQVQLSVKHYNGKEYQDTTVEAVMVERPSHTNYDIVIIPVDTGNHLPHKIVVKKDTRIKFVTNELTDPLEDLGSYTSMSLCKIPPFSYNTYDFGVVHKLSPGDHFFVSKDPSLCNEGRRLQITVEDE